MRDTKRDFEEYALPHLVAVHHAAFGLCGHRQNAEDLVQRTFLKAFERFHTFKEGTNCKAWLFRILRNTWIDELRRKKNKETILPIQELDKMEAANSDDKVMLNPRDSLEKLTDEQVIKALMTLPEDQRFTLVLSDVEQCTQQEIAEILNLPIGTVKSRITRARNILKAKLYCHAKDLGLLGRNV